MKYTYRRVLYLYTYIHSYIQSTLHIVSWQTNETESVYCVESVLTRSSATSFFRSKLNRAPTIENSPCTYHRTCMHTHSINNIALLACLRHISAYVCASGTIVAASSLSHAHSYCSRAWCCFPRSHTVPSVHRLWHKSSEFPLQTRTNIISPDEVTQTECTYVRTNKRTNQLR